MTNLDSMTELEFAVQEAEQRRRHGDLSGAFESYKTILTKRLIGRQTGQPAVESLKAADLIVMERLAELSVLFGYHEAADNLLNAVAGLCQQADNRYGADYAMLRRIYLAVTLGQVDKALNLLQSLKSTFGDWQHLPLSTDMLKNWESERYWPNTDESGRSLLLAYFYTVLGLLLIATGQYERSQFVLNRALDFSNDPEASDIVRRMQLPIQLALVRSWLEKGKLTTAEKELEKLELQIDERKQPGFKVQWLEIAAKINLLRGNLGTAVKYINQTLTLCRERKFSLAILKAKLNVAHVRTYLNQTAEAKIILEEVRESARALNDEIIETRATALLSLAQVRGQSMVGGVPIAPSVSEIWSPKKRSKATTNSEQSQTKFSIPQASSHLAYFEDQTLMFYWQLGHGDLSTAVTLLQQIRQNFGKSDSDLIQARLKMLTGILAYYQQQIKEAEVILSQTRQTLQAMGLIPELWQLQRFLRWCWIRLGYPVTELHALTRETENLLEAMTESLETSDQVIFLLNKWEPEEEYIASEIDQLVRLKRQAEQGFLPLRLWRRWQMWDRLSQLIAHIDRYKDTRTKRTVLGHKEDIERPDAPSLWQRLRSHQRDQYTLSFLVLPDRVLLIRVSRFSLDFSVSPTTRIQVREAVRRWHELVAWSLGQRPSRALYFGVDEDDELPSTETIVKEAKQESKRVAQTLAEALQIPDVLRTLPPSVSSLTIVPDDSLHGFPFAAIRYQDRYLVEQYAFSINYEHEYQATSKNTKKPNSLLVGVSKGSGQISPLPGVLSELDRIKNWLVKRQNEEQIHTLLNDEADKQTVIRQLEQANLVHLACHGIFECNKPDSSGFVLIPTPNQVEILSLRELIETDLSGVNHATLSSCWSADHFMLPGRWVISLPETIWRAGAHSILASLWEVDDRVAVAFMTSFYEKSQQMSRAEALRQTQIECLKNQLPECLRIDTSSAFYWAGYTLYGDSGHFGL